jgi:hypothetical protein
MVRLCLSFVCPHGKRHTSEPYIRPMRNRFKIVIELANKEERVLRRKCVWRQRTLPAWPRTHMCARNGLDRIDSYCQGLCGQPRTSVCVIYIRT